MTCKSKRAVSFPPRTQDRTTALASHRHPLHPLRRSLRRPSCCSLRAYCICCFFLIPLLLRPLDQFTLPWPFHPPPYERCPIGPPVHTLPSRTAFLKVFPLNSLNTDPRNNHSQSVLSLRWSGLEPPRCGIKCNTGNNLSSNNNHNTNNNNNNTSNSNNNNTSSSSSSSNTLAENR